jgi:nucleoside-triphosphatase
MRASSILLLTGVPGVGKTRVIQRVAGGISESRVSGFFTEEIRPGSHRRLGFRAVTFDGRETVISHVDFPGPQRVGRYGVEVAALDELAGWAVETLAPERVYLIDEIGKMECCSDRLVAALRRLLDSGAPVVATVAVRGGGLIAEVKTRPDAELWEVTRKNRDGLPARILSWLSRRTANSECRTVK